MRAREGRAGVLAILGRPQARKLCAAALTSSLAAWTAQVALLVGVLQQHAGSDLAWVLLAATVPALAAGTPAGAVVDRHDPRRIAQITGSGAVLLLAATGATLGSTLAAGTACYALFLVAGRFTDPASLRLLYATLPASQRAAGNAALGTATGITTVIGAAIGAAGVSTLGTGACFGLAAGLQAGAAAILWTLGPARTRTPPPPGDSQPGFRRSLGETLAALRRYPLAASIITVGIAWGLIGGSYDVLLGIYGTHLLRGGGGASVGVLYAADGAGVLAGSLLAAHLPGRLERGSYALAYVLQGALWAAFAVSQSLVEAVPTLLAMRVASGVIIAVDTTLLLVTVPDHLHGRVYSAHAATYGAVMRVSLALTGALLLAVSPRAVTLGAGLASVLVGAAWWLVTGRSTRPASPQLAWPRTGNLIIRYHAVMRTMTATEASRHFSELLDAVERGERVTILRGSHPVAEIGPAHSHTGADLRIALEGTPPPDDTFAAEISAALALVASEVADPWAGA